MTKYLTGPLKAVVNDQPKLRAWCGPTVVAAITGKPISEIKALIKARRGHNGGVMGTYAAELCATLKAYGYHSRIQPVAGAPTLRQWARARSPEQRRQTIIVNVTGHWVVVRGNPCVDTSSKGKPVLISEAPGGRKRVERIMVVWRMSPAERQSSAKVRGATVAKARRITEAAKRTDPHAPGRAAFAREIRRLAGNVAYHAYRGCYVSLYPAANRTCSKLSDTERTIFDAGLYWQRAADFLKTLKPRDFKVRFTLDRAA